MKKIISIIVTIVIISQLFSVVPSFAADEAGEVYTAPESQAVTYNMNLDWKYKEAPNGVTTPFQTAVDAVKNANGKQFYEVDYDDSDWESVSIPHAVNGEDAFAGVTSDNGGGAGRLGVFLYRKTFTVPETAAGGKVFFELEGIRQAAYLWVNGKKVGYYEAGITAMGFDITKFVEPGEQALIAIANDATATKGNPNRVMYETVPGEAWGSSYTPNNGTTRNGDGAGYQWNTRDFNEVQAGLVYDAYLHVKGSVYQTLPLYNNLKTTGNYIYADNFDIRAGKATINVDAEVRNETTSDAKYSLEVAVVDNNGKLAYKFAGNAVTVPAAKDAGAVYETVVEKAVYTTEKNDLVENMPDSDIDMINDASKRPEYNDAGKYTTYKEVWSDWTAVTADRPDFDDRGYRIKYATYSGNKYTETADKTKATHYSILQRVERTTHNEIGSAEVDTVDVTHITASYAASDVRFWSIDDPYLYTVYTILKDESGNVVDVQKKDTGFRKVEYDAARGVLINDKPVWLKGYAQRATNEWAVIGVAPDWLTDYDMSLLKENNSNFIRWMHVAPKPAAVRSSDRYGIAVVCPAGDKEGEAEGRQWSQREEAMRDAMIYFRNSPSVLFWETGNNAINAPKAMAMKDLRLKLDPKGMRFIGARSTADSPDQLNYEYNYAGTMYGNHGAAAKGAMEKNGIMGPIMETEYARPEAPRRVWDDYSPPDFDYVNQFLYGMSKKDGYDVHDQTQESITVANVREYNGYYANRAGSGASIYSAEAMMVWSDSNMHGRNAATENCRTSGRVDAVRQTKEMFEGTRVAHSTEPAVHIIGHWSYPELSDDTYNYFDRDKIPVGTDSKGNEWGYYQFNTNKKLKRDPEHKTVYAIGSTDVKKIELYRLDGDAETKIGEDSSAEDTFVYQFDDVDVTKGDGVIAKAYNARGDMIAKDEIVRTGDAASIKLIPHTAVRTENDETVSDWRADGSDIAYFDVQVLDAKGNVCALNYDRIDFKYEGDGVYLGGYNSGTGSSCFQNTEASKGLSNYFGGAKDGVSTIRKDYVYAENGTNRIFVKSTRNAGTFKLTATMDIPGMLPATAEITSVSVDSKNGLTLQMPSVLRPGLSSSRPSASNTSALKPLAAGFKAIWSNAVIEKVVDTNVYYTTLVNGTELTMPDEQRTRQGNPTGVFGSLSRILDALNQAGANLNYSIQGTPLTLTFDDGEHEYTIRAGYNDILTDGQDPTEIVQNAMDINGELFANLAVLQTYFGIGVNIDEANKTVNIVYAIQ